ncbi:MAG: YceI family protein [Anaerolineales bacterium]
MSWYVDTNHSQINFSAKHMGIFTVRGRFDKFEIQFNYDEANPENTTVTAKIDAASITTNNDQRDGHLKSPDFLHVAQYPYLVFESTRVQKLTATTGKLYGNLTIRNETHPVVLDVEFTGQAKSPWGVVSAGFLANGKLDRTQWGLTWNQALETGGLLVGNEIGLHLELEAVKQAVAVPA